MLKSIRKYVVLSVLFIGSNCFAANETYIEDGELGIKAFQQGNLITAMELLNKSAIHGYAPAQTTLAYILDQSEENERAFELYQQAANNSYPAGMFGLASMYAKGEGAPLNPVKAGQWIKKSALLKHVPAMRALAYALESGSLGFDKDEEQAFQWYSQCDKAGDVVCTRRLMQAYAKGELGKTIDKKTAEVLQRQLNRPLKGEN